MTSTRHNKWSLLLFCATWAYHLLLVIKHVHSVYSNVLGCFKSVRQFLSWNINMHWQRLISCGYRTYPTELLMAEMIDILSLNNGLAIPCCLQSATRAISKMLKSIRLLVCTTSWRRISSYKNWSCRVVWERIPLSCLESKPLSKWCIHFTHKLN